MRDYLTILILIFTFLISCDDDSKIYSVGEDFVDLNTRIVQIDTLSLKPSTIILDSLITSNTGRLLIGASQDNVFGKVTSQSYFETSISNFEINDDAVYDSIALILHYDHYYYGDTTQVQTYKVHEITETFEPNNNDDDNFYNTSKLKFSDEILGELSFTPHPIKKDSIYILLNNSLGEKLFNGILNNDINNFDDLTQIFKGVTIIPDKNSNTMLGFNYSSSSTPQSNSVIRMYYTVEDEDDEDNDYYKDLFISSSSQQFNQITSDKTNTLLSAITDDEYILPSSKTNNVSYIQSGTGIGMRINIPSIKNVSALEGNGTSLYASLKMYPLKESYNDRISLVDSLVVYVVDHKNRIIEQLSGFDGSVVYATLTSNNDEFNENCYYTTDISLFTEEILANTYNDDYALLFLLSDYNKSINSVLVHDSHSSETKMKLSLTYMLY
ncbi:DUF4270 family protein [Lutibacter sp. B1]|uniref:DUF4270 family protein n=1 Tax=Lutibacter sp. B1 TaxID=2725996 RepID=UPI0014575EFA|nr:DUF4270 family protein [Lutibacter sp. B1]NLP58538.1 DUF4270 domain-containing protein [Lutibacter sp. B1]